MKKLIEKLKNLFGLSDKPSRQVKPVKQNTKPTKRHSGCSSYTPTLVWDNCGLSNTAMPTLPNPPVDNSGMPRIPKKSSAMPTLPNFSWSGCSSSDSSSSCDSSSSSYDC